MTATALVQARIDPALKERAAAVPHKMGLTVSDTVRILLTRIANEGALPFAFAVDPAVHDAWFRAKVQEALDDPRPAIRMRGPKPVSPGVARPRFGKPVKVTREA